MTATEFKLLEYAAEELDNALDKTNAFFNTKWKAYKKEMEQLELSPFKKTKSFEMKASD